jgi:A/G-specific adenine glycosylase
LVTMSLPALLDPDLIRSRLLRWYDAHARTLAWRVGPGQGAVRADPYRVWLSEVMLQQTTVPHATPYFLKFTQAWPRVEDLAAAPDGDVMAAWAGLGYYARARNLLACARAVASQHGGVFPDTEEALLRLPGVGAYTAAAVAAIAFDRAANVVDGNVERVISRLYAVQDPLPDAKPQLKTLAAGLVREDRPGDWAQALMDLGATVCRPKQPLCLICPLAEVCAAKAEGEPQTYPRKRQKAARPKRYGVAFVIRCGDTLALIRRPDKGLLGGMLALPSTDWRSKPWADAEVAPPISAEWVTAGRIDHVFTHFALSLTVWVAQGDLSDAIWTRADDLGALPSVFLKAAQAGLGLNYGRG